MRDTEAWEIRDAITENTAAVAYVANAQARPLLSEVVVSAHTHNVPVIVDATCQLPPQSNLERFIAEGADVVCFSGGKAIRGPQSSDILCGLRDLISAAALQHLDQDVFIDLWNPPDSLIDKSKLPGAPHHGLGRPYKVGKEEIVGIITALSLFVSEGDEARSDRWRGIAFHLVELLKSIPYLSVSVTLNHARTVPTVNVELDE